MHCGPELTLCGGPAPLGVIQLLAHVSHWPVLLYQHCPDGNVRRVHDDFERCVKVRHLECGRRGEGLLQSLETVLVEAGPHRSEWAFGVDELVQRRCYGSKVTDESAEVVGKPHESVQLLGGGGNRPLFHDLNLARVHATAVAGHQVPEEADLWLVELALLGIEIDAVLAQDVQHKLVVSQVLLSCAAEDKYVVHVDLDEGA